MEGRRRRTTRQGKAAEVDVQQTGDTYDWYVANGRLSAGEILYLPNGWWHYVDSTPHTVMTNVWARAEEM